MMMLVARETETGLLSNLIWREYVYATVSR